MGVPPGRKRLLNAAERLFAEQGVDATSARAINAAADLSPAALHYHFGNKERVVEEVLHRRMEELKGRRAQMVADARDNGVAFNSRLIAEMLVLPLADFALGEGRPGRWYIRFLSRMFTEKPDMVIEFIEKSFGDGVRILDEMIMAAAPGLEPDEAVRRRLIMFETATHCLSHIAERATEQEGDVRAESEPMIRSIVAFIAAGVVAPLS